MAYPDVSPRARAAFVLAALSRDISDAARDLVADIATQHQPGELVYRVRRQLRVATVAAVDLAILIEAYDGTPWEDIADRTLMPVDELRSRFEPTLEQWHAGVYVDPPNAVVYARDLPAFTHDATPFDTAAAIDDWCARANDPRDIVSGDGPVTRALAST